MSAELIYFGFLRSNVRFKFERTGKSNVPGTFESNTRAYQGFDKVKDAEIIKELRKFAQRRDSVGKPIVRELPGPPAQTVLDKFANILHRGRNRIASNRSNTDAAKGAIQEFEEDMREFVNACCQTKA